MKAAGQLADKEIHPFTPISFFWIGQEILSIYSSLVTSAIEAPPPCTLTLTTSAGDWPSVRTYRGTFSLKDISPFVSYGTTSKGQFHWTSISYSNHLWFAQNFWDISLFREPKNFPQGKPEPPNGPPLQRQLQGSVRWSWDFWCRRLWSQKIWLQMTWQPCWGLLLVSWHQGLIRIHWKPEILIDTHRYTLKQSFFEIWRSFGKIILTD